jgi:hypothetical protein
MTGKPGSPGCWPLTAVRPVPRSWRFRWVSCCRIPSPAAGLAASPGIIAATFPLLNRITGPEAARNE